jgi:hypothetical protein
MATTLLSVLLVGYLPGAMTFRLPVARRDRRAALPAEERVFWAVVLSVAWSLIVTLLLAAFERYRFERLLILSLALCVALLLLARRGLSFRGSAPSPTWSALIPLAIIAAGLWLYFPPAEYVMGGKDPGVYLNAGIQIAQRGALVIHDDTIDAVPPFARDLFLPGGVVRFMGFFVRRVGDDAVISQFPHLYPASIAIGYGLNGLSGARQAVGVWAVLGLLAVYFVGVRLFGRLTAIGGVVLLAVNVVTIWYARYPNAEVVMQALLFASMLATTHALIDDDRFFGPVAGWLLGLLLCLRIDAALAIVACLGALMAARYTGRSVGPGFFATLVPTAAVTLWYLLAVMERYSRLPVAAARDIVTAPLIAIACVAAVVAWRGAHVAWMQRLVVRTLPLVLVVTLSSAGVYAYTWRVPSGRLALHDALALQMYGWYVTPGALLAALAALAIVVPRVFWRDPVVFGVAGLYSAFVFYKIRIVPEHFWMTRRFLPIILPATMLLVAAMAARVTSPWRRAAPPDRAVGRQWPSWPRRWQRALAAAGTLALLSPLGWSYWVTSRPVRHHVEYAGLIPRLEQLAARFDPRDLVIVESRNSSDAHVLALPLAYIYARHVLVLASPRPDRWRLAEFLARARQRFREIYFVGSGGTDLLSPRIAAQPITRVRFDVPEYDSPYNAYPAGVRRKYFDLGLYRLVLPEMAATAAGLALTIGDWDDLFVLRFHDRERHGRTGQPFRWSRDVSYIMLAGIPPHPRSLTIWMSDGHRPPSASKARVSVAIDDHVLGEIAPEREVSPFTLTLPSGLLGDLRSRADPPRLRLQVPTWNPRKTIGIPDDRELGVMVARVEVK